MLKVTLEQFRAGRVSAQEKAGALRVSIGTDRAGNGVDIDIRELPHLLIGGMVGTGKSTLIHRILTSLIAEHEPDRLRLILGDPKHIELGVYNGVAHMLTEEVICDARKTIKALKWANQEIDRRYQVLKTEGIRSIDAYYAKLYRRTEKEDDDAQMQALPHILVVIDEMSDAMLKYPREIEGAIMRISQLGSPVGVHLLLATSNTSSKMSTNGVKMNIPARIAFQVSAEADSRSILGMGGAEKLQGKGAALYLTRDMREPLQLHILDMPDDSLQEKVKAVKKKCPNEPSSESLSEDDGRSFENIFTSDSAEPEDELYPEAERAVREAGKASTSYIQRRLGIGYARAAQLMDRLTERGVITEADGAQPRKVIQRASQVDDRQESGR